MQVQKTEVYISNYLTAPCARRQISLDTPVFFKSGILFLHCLTVFSCLCFVTASFPFPQPSLHQIGSIKSIYSTAQKMKFSIKDFFSKFDQVRSFLRIFMLDISYDSLDILAFTFIFD